jgi:phosphoribosyl-ATP pyrophosphohydrolase
MGFEIDFDPATRSGRKVPAEPVPLPRPQGGPDVLNRLWVIIENRKNADPDISHSARLLARGTARVAQKLGEEAVECLIEAIAGNRDGLIGESADVLYHLLVTWVDAGIRPEEVWQALQQRERVSYLTEGAVVPLKRLLGSVQIGTSKIP